MTISPRPKVSCSQPLGQDVRVDFETLQRLFHLRQDKVAEQLGICLTSLKSACRKLGIRRWPYIKSIGHAQKKKDANARTLVSNVDYNLMAFFATSCSQLSGEVASGPSLAEPQSEPARPPCAGSSRHHVAQPSPQEDPIVRELGISLSEDEEVGWEEWLQCLCGTDESVEAVGV